MDEDENERTVGSDSGTEHTSHNESIHDADDYFDDSRDSTRVETEEEGWINLW